MWSQEMSRKQRSSRTKPYNERLCNKRQWEIKAYHNASKDKTKDKHTKTTTKKRKSEKRFFQKLHALHNSPPAIASALSKKPLSKMWSEAFCLSEASNLIRKTERNFRTRVAKIRARRATAVAAAAQLNSQIINKKKRQPPMQLKIGGGFNLYGSEGPGADESP